MRWTTVVLAAAIGCVRVGGELAGSDRDADDVAGATSASPAQARTVTTIDDAIQAIAVHDDRLFVGTGSCIPDPAAPGSTVPVGRIMSVSIDGGEPTTLWTGAEWVAALAVRDDDVFAQTDAECMVGHSVSLRHLPASGGGDQPIGSWRGGLFCAKLLAASDALYWLMPGAVHRYDGRNDTVLATGYTCDGDMAMSGGRLVWAAAYALDSVAPSGGTVSTIWQGSDNVYHMAADPLGRGFYIATTDALSIIGVDGRAQEIVGGRERIDAVIADDRAVYWAEPTKAQILRRSWEGGAATVVVSGADAGALAQTPRDLLWVEYDPARRVSSVKRIAKPLP